jgi:hypothetical protein
MAFKKKTKLTTVPDSPDKLLLEFPRRKIPDVLPHQREVMRTYATSYVERSDVALQLPTGSGKTLVGLLIAEWRRRKFGERVVYLCPTKQLVHQTVEQGEEKYGLTTIGFTGRVRDYDPSSKAEYRNADHIAVTTYNSLFNTNPFFNDADVVIVDDAHAAEGYIASMWSLNVERFNSAHSALHTALAAVLKPYLDSANFSRLSGNWYGPSDRTWADKLPTPVFMKMADEFSEIFSAHVNDTDLEYPWSMIKAHLHGCQLYLSAQNILLRPLIPPTWTHEPFSSPKQRVFMSATLGAGGDLERLTGRRTIARLPIPEGWERQGVGRRFFVFPEMSLNDKGAEKLRQTLMKRAKRSLVLVPSQTICDEIAEDVEKELKVPVFKAEDIEYSKKPFIESEAAVAVVANRYDGIDFPGDECRLLFIDGLPKATNSQERFLMTRMGANLLFRERIQTRVMQAIGRCTRSLEDYSAVIVTGEELTDYLADIKKRKYLHPELQAEISFGVEQSKNMAIEDLVENFEIFINNGAEWEEVNKDIVAERDASKREPFPAIDELGNVVGKEITYQMCLWNADYEGSLEAAEGVLAGLKSSDLKGYRALWHYLAGSAAWLGFKTGVPSLESKARVHFEQAKKATASIPWLVSLARFQPKIEDIDDADDSVLAIQLERVESILSQLGIVHEGKFAEREKCILEGLLSKDKGPFEEAHRLLGELIGFVSGNVEEDGSPDPWWISKEFCFVFEDHQGAKETSALDTTKARQAALHPNWIKRNVKEADGLETIPVIVTPVSKAKTGAMPHLNEVFLWPLEDFRRWARAAVATVREVRKTFSEAGDLEWREMTAKKFKEEGLTARDIAKKLKLSRAADILQEVN